MRPIEWILLSVIAILIIAVTIFEVWDKRRRNRIESARRQWLEARKKREKWHTDPAHQIGSPHGQWLLRAEVGAFDFYMLAKLEPAVTDRRYSEQLCAGLIDDPYIQDPEPRTFK
ncbi:MAG TPA: hypothetical protein VHE10_02105 [Candidatus Paceibacterota bacterium]|nr:hypothetical protein [Candidatus Paceibacterota bacterium]